MVVFCWWLCVSGVSSLKCHRWADRGICFSCCFPCFACCLMIDVFTYLFASFLCFGSFLMVCVFMYLFMIFVWLAFAVDVYVSFNCCTIFGFVYYSCGASSPNQNRWADRDMCVGFCFAFFCFLFDDLGVYVFVCELFFFGWLCWSFYNVWYVWVWAVANPSGDFTTRGVRDHWNKTEERTETRLLFSSRPLFVVWWLVCWCICLKVVFLRLFLLMVLRVTCVNLNYSRICLVTLLRALCELT